jgi:uncharacterized protein (DUF433 family)
MTPKAAAARTKAISDRFRAGGSVAELADQYGLTRDAIEEILRATLWRTD